jgi:hypothetical protein
MSKIFLAIPHNGSVIGGVITGCCNCSSKHKVLTAECPFGCLTHNFNVMWTTALNNRENGITHFAMLHSDIIPQPLFLDVLMDELEANDADVMSAVIAIKDNRGLTSTGLGWPGEWGVKRLTLAELMAMPETFSLAFTEHEPGQYLAFNTGLWVADLRRPWVDDFPGFKVQNRIHRNAEGVYCAQFRPEDWDFSEWTHRRGLRAFVTRKCGANHRGVMDFGNGSSWGTMATDEDYETGKTIELGEIVSEAEVDEEIRCSA